MPGMTGIDLAKEIRRRHFDLPVVLTSGYSQMLSQNGSYGFELLQKPYSIEQLARALHKVGRWRKMKRGAAEGMDSDARSVFPVIAASQPVGPHRSREFAPD